MRSGGAVYFYAAHANETRPNPARRMEPSSSPGNSSQKNSFSARSVWYGVARSAVTVEGSLCRGYNNLTNSTAKIIPIIRIAGGTEVGSQNGVNAAALLGRDILDLSV